MKPTKFIPVLIISIALLFGPALTSQAAPEATCNVPTTKYPTIGEALSKDKCTTINIAAGTYNEHDLSVNRDLTINGAGASTTIIDGDSNPILYVGFPTTTFALSNVTLQNAATHGGALALDTDVAATVSDVTFKKNTFGIWMQGGTLELFHSKFKSNNNPLNTGAAISRDANGGNIYIESTQFKKNKADCAAAIYSATDSGTAQLNIFNSQFRKNTSNGPGCKGGAIYTQDPTQISGSKFSGNNATMAASAGGAVYQTGIGMSVDSSTFSGNSAAEGGGLYSYGSSSLTVTQSTFDANIAFVGSGGGLFISSPTNPAVLINSTFYKNEAQGNGKGGGIYLFDSTAYLSFVTLSENTAFLGGSLLVVDSTLWLKSSILNLGAPDNCVVNASTLNSKGSNISSDASCAAYLTKKGDKSNTDPLLDVLANNGGNTQTQALLPGSPALNKSKNCKDAGGSVLLGDQRGLPRFPPPGGKCDIGAYEVQ